MPDNYSKLWIQENLAKNAQARALEAIQQTGRALPCKVTNVLGSMVTVSFEVMPAPWLLPPITIPKAESQWLRAPTQVGDFGMTVPADTFLGGISGQGDGVADLSVNYGNMSTLVWVPVGSSKFGVTPDPNKAWINGPNGAVMSDTVQKNTIVIDNDPSITSTVTAAESAIVASGASTLIHELDGVNNAITHQLTNTLGPLIHKMDGVANTINHEVQSAEGAVYTIVDGAGNAISHVVPTGGKVGVGDLASNLASTTAAAVQADLQTLANNVVAQTLQTMSTAIGAAAITAGIPNGAAFHAILAAAGFITGLSGINPTIPGCSPYVFIRRT